MRTRDQGDIALGAADNTVTVVDDFVTLADCRWMLGEAMRGEWVGSAVVHGGSVIRVRGRRSASLMQPAYSDCAEAWLREVERRLAAMLAIEPRNLEPWQMTRYRRAGAYDYHLDCGEWASDPSGERRRTILIVLEQPARGGATHFRALHRTIRPVVGRLVVWCNLLPTGGCNHAMIHSGRPVWQGRKTILTTWERQRPYVR